MAIGDDTFRGSGGQNRQFFLEELQSDIVQSIENSETIVSVIDYESNRDGTDLYLDVEEFDFNGTVYK